MSPSLFDRLFVNKHATAKAYVHDWLEPDHNRINFFSGAIIALVGCHFGMTTRGGTAGVGNSTTRTVVVVSIAILIADFFLTKLAIIFWPTQ